MDDYTRISLEQDPTKLRFYGVATHGLTPFDVPYISHIEGNLWSGGCSKGLVLPTNIKHVVSLYPWERYTVKHDLESELYVRAYDDHVSLIVDRLQPLVEWILRFLEQGPTLVHCQAGLNRSGLLSALVLMRLGRSAQDAIALLREKRSPAVLCNKSFEEYLLTPRPRTHSILRESEI